MGAGARARGAGGSRRWATSCAPRSPRAGATCPRGRTCCARSPSPFDEVRVLIVGQDPYPTPGHAVGLSFSVAPDVRPMPRSLANIFREYTERPRPPDAVHRRPHAVGRAGRAAAQQGAHRRAGAARARTAARAGRRSPSRRSARSSPRRRAARGDPVGPRRPQPAPAARRRAADRVGAPEPDVGRPGLLRLAAVQPGQRAAGGAGRRRRWTGSCRERVAAQTPPSRWGGGALWR